MHQVYADTNANVELNRGAIALKATQSHGIVTLRVSATPGGCPADARGTASFQSSSLSLSLTSSALPLVTTRHAMRTISANQ